jgi:ABC-type bacteriocin/lantibiotic exporter with double-glycine peptidase domain
MFSYVPQNSFLINDTILNNLVFYGNKKIDDNNSILKLIKIIELEKFIDGLENGLNTIVGEDGKMISGGEKQRISIGRAIYSDCQIIIFDEATSGLDEKTQEKLIENIKKLKDLTKIIISHDEKVLKKCDTIYKIENKTIKKIINF